MKHALRFLIGVWVLALVARPADAQEPPKMSTPHLSAMTLGKVDRNAGTAAVEIFETVPITKSVNVPVIVTVDGMKKTVYEPRTVTEYTTVVKQVVLSIEDARVFTGDGKELSGDARRDALKQGAVVLTGTGEAADPKWFKLLKPDAVLLLTSPRPAARPAPPPTPPAPKPE